MKQILMNTRLLNDIKKLSSEDQTSCLEGFHSTLNQFHPKMNVSHGLAHTAGRVCKLLYWTSEVDVIYQH